MPESQTKMPKSAPKTLKVPTLIRSIRSTFSLRCHLGCSSSSAAAIRVSANWQPAAQPDTKVKSKHRKVTVTTTAKIASNRRSRRQQFAVGEAPPASPSPASNSSPDSFFSSNNRRRERRQPVTLACLSSTELPKMLGRCTSPVNAASIDFESVFRTARSRAEAFVTRYQQRTPEEISQNSHDPFGAWRLDTDNMTYEQLLTLGDKMGYVTTGLKESEIINRVKKINFSGNTSLPFLEEAEPKCSICQDEYENGDELGLLICAHSYHRHCIKQWLRHKKICPICMTEVVPRR